MSEIPDETEIVDFVNGQRVKRVKPKTAGEMVERISKALEIAMDEMAGDDGYYFGKEGYEKLTRIAIELMREPTDDMKRAGWHVLREKNDFQRRLGNSLVGTETPVYSAMIGAALE